MKKIQHYIQNRELSNKKKLDEKTIAWIFLNAAKKEIHNFQNKDIREIKLKNKNLHIKTVHPVVSSELCIQREKIIREANKLAGENVIKKIAIF